MFIKFRYICANYISTRYNVICYIRRSQSFNLQSGPDIKSYFTRIDSSTLCHTNGTIIEASIHKNDVFAIKTTLVRTAEFQVTFGRPDKMHGFFQKFSDAAKYLEGQLITNSIYLKLEWRCNPGR